MISPTKVGAQVFFPRHQLRVKTCSMICFCCLINYGLKPVAWEGFRLLEHSRSANQQVGNKEVSRLTDTLGEHGLLPSAPSTMNPHPQTSGRKRPE